jgi:hypothetical protein
METELLDKPPADSTGVADTPSQFDQAALSDSAIETALDQELGLAPISDAPDPDLQDVNLDKSEAATADDTTTIADESAAADPAEPSSEDEADTDRAALAAIPEELQPKVGSLLKEMRERTRAKSAEKLTAAEQRAAELSERLPTLEQERDELRGSLDELRAERAVPASTARNPLASVTSLADLDSAEEALWSMRTQLVSDPTNMQIPDGQGGQRYLEEGEAQRRIAAIDERLQRFLPRQRQLLQQQESGRTALLDEFPDYGKRGSELQRSVSRAIAANPELKASANYHRTALAQAIGEQMLRVHGKQAWAQATTKVAPAATVSKTVKAKTEPKPPPPVRTQAAPRRATQTDPVGEFSQTQYDAYLGL